MKKIVSVISLIASLMIISACSKSNNSDSAPIPEPATSFSVIIDGKLFTADHVLALSDGSQSTQISANDDHGKSFGFNCKGSTPGTYPFGNNNHIYSQLDNYSCFFSILCDDITGSVIISKFDSANKKISGTFAFSGTDGPINYILTDGKFVNVPLTVLKK